MKINTRVEGIFAQAVAMDNRGMKNIIHCIGSNVFIVNFDYSMILQFSLRQSELAFDESISFNANEYDSSNFELDGNKIVFHTKGKTYERKKICQANPSGPDAKGVRKIYHQLKKEGEKSPYLFYLSDECVPLLEDGLSHTEISVEKSKLILRQRDVYTGTIIEVAAKGGNEFFTADSLPKNLSPFALKTKDFMSLFGIRKSLAFVPADNFLMVRDSIKDDFSGILALCTYSTIIDLYEEENNGRQEPKTGTSEQKADRQDQRPKLMRRK